MTAPRADRALEQLYIYGKVCYDSGTKRKHPRAANAGCVSHRSKPVTDNPFYHVSPVHSNFIDDPVLPDIDPPDPAALLIWMRTPHGERFEILDTRDYVACLERIGWVRDE